MNREQKREFVGDLVDHLRTGYRPERPKLYTGAEATVLGASGYRHPLDVVADFDDVVHLYSVRMARSNGPEAVLAYAACIDDIARARPGTDLFSYLITHPKGLTGNARRLAEHYVVEVLVAQRRNGAYWASSIRIPQVVRPADRSERFFLGPDSRGR